MAHLKKFQIFIAVLLAVLVIAACGLAVYFQKLPENTGRVEALLLGQKQFVPGSHSAVRVLVRDRKDASAIANAQVRILLRAKNGQEIPLFDGQTGERGSLEAGFTVPEDVEPDSLLVVETSSGRGSSRLERGVTIDRDYRILLTTDKPLYQPGQVIHLRALALSSSDLRPGAGQEVEFVIADGKGNKVFRRTLAASEYGVAAVDFQLASEVNLGPYKISAAIGETLSEKIVQVERYLLPKFDVRLVAERSYYLPGERVRASLEAVYFYGKPVSHAEVRLEGYTFDVERTPTFSLEGQTDENGRLEFEFDLPDYLAGADAESGLGRYYLEAAVTDRAHHSEISNLSLPVSGAPILIEAIPESGEFRRDVENILYVITSYPDGSPAQTSLDINGQVQARTGPEGLAEIHLEPSGGWETFDITASDEQGRASRRSFAPGLGDQADSVLLRPDRPVYRVGETMNLAVLTSASQGSVYLDIVREGQTASTRTLEIAGGRGEAAVDLTPDLFGTLELHAYKVLPSGEIARDTRLVVVDNANALEVSILPGQESYLPGEQARLDVQVRGQDGQGVPAALGLAIVDESVFALAEEDPGFARLYFLLQQELLEPKIELHGFTIPEAVLEKETFPVEKLQVMQGAAFASLAQAIPRQALFSLYGNSHEDAVAQASDRRAGFFLRLPVWLQWPLLAFGLAAAGLGLVSLWKRRLLWPSLGILFLSLILVALLLVGLPPLGLLALLGLPLALIPGGIAVLVKAVQRKDPLVIWMAGLSLGFLALFAVLAAGTYLANDFSDAARNAVYLSLALLLLVLASLALQVISLFLRKAAKPSGGALSALLLVALCASWLAGCAGQAPLPLPDVLQAPGANPTTAQETPAALEAGGTGAAAEPPRLRQYFPETLLWLPEAVTGQDGQLQLDFPVADSITTWRVTALASTRDGRLGSSSAGLRVFQDFFIDLDLPLALTVGDEVAVPVGVFNYLPEAQSVRLEVQPQDWFELLDPPVQELVIQGNDIGVVYFRIRALGFGQQPLRVTAVGTHMSDAIQKEVRVYPDGKEITFTQSDRLAAGEPVRQVLQVPAQAIPGTQKLLVKVYPGVVSQVVEGLESILRMPSGCFEQTSSITYPNLLVLDYLKTTGQAAPEVQLKAEAYINQGYQRLLTFEVQGSGGFSLFGDAPPDRMLTAYGLQEFADMSRVHAVDPDLLQRSAEWLFSQQAGNGAWENDRGLYHESETWRKLADDRLPVTAYIAWSLVEAGFGGDPRTQNALAYVRENITSESEPYVLALAANALVAADLTSGNQIGDATRGVLDRLAESARRDGSAAFWPSSVATFMGSEGEVGSIETTALAAQALMRSGVHSDLGSLALTYLVRQKDSFGTWYSTQATVQSLKALIWNARLGEERVNAAVTVRLNGSQERAVQITPENHDVVQLLSFDDLNVDRENVVEIETQGQGSLMYQIAGSYYLPWEALPDYPELAEGERLLDLEVRYDRAELAVDDTVTVTVRAALREGQAESALIDLGLPPGFDLRGEDLDALVERFNAGPEGLPTIERYELAGRQLIVYVQNLSAGNPLEFSYRLQARYPLRAQTPASSAYDYYNPALAGESAPQVLVVGR